MNQAVFLGHLDQLSSSYFVIELLLLQGVAIGVLVWIGLIPWAMTVIASLARGSIRHGFQWWERLFSWASWPIFLSIMLASLFVGWGTSRSLPILTVTCSLIPLGMGVTACLAYMLIDLERYAVSRGYKSVHNPLPGQELAANLVRYGQVVQVPLLVSATVGMIGGFALLNFALYVTIGRDWYVVKESQGDATYIDFVANALIVLLKIVDVLDFAKTSHLLEISYVHQVRWPATTLLTGFRMFFTMVLLQQISASFRQGQVLGETISDLWSPHEPIHARASHALPQYGPGAVGPLLVSLGRITSLTKEQRERLPVILAAIGPAAIPALTRHLHEKREHVRAISVAALGQLRELDTITVLIPLSRDASEIVRQSLIEALGNIVGPGRVTTVAKPAMIATRHRLLRTLRWRRSVPVCTEVLIELAVQTLQTALTDAALSVRAQAARALGQIGPSAAMTAPALISLLQDEDETVRQAAIEAVGKVGGSAAMIVDALTPMLSDASPLLRASAARELGSLGEAAREAFPQLAALLLDRDDAVREAVAEAIGQIGDLDLEATEGLVSGLSSPDTVVRAQTAEALGTIGTTAHEAASSLVDALSDRNDTVRAKAAEALGKIGEASADVAVPGLVRALRDRDDVVSSLAAEALGHMGESADGTIPSLIRSLQHVNADVRASSAESLGKLGIDDVDAASALERASRDEDAYVRAQAIRALGLLEHESTQINPSILAGLDDTDSEVRLAAVDSLSHAGQPDAALLPLMLSLLEDPNEKVRALVTTVLPRMAGPRPSVIAGLCCRLRDDTDLVQAQAAEALGELGPAVATAAGEALLHAAQTGERTVRERSQHAIMLIRPSETIALMDEAHIVPGLIEALRDIENQTQLDSTLADVIPILVTPLIDPLSGESMDTELGLGIVVREDAGFSRQEPANVADATEVRHD